jgi:hypothetical protein
MFDVSVATLLQHLLFLFVLVATPIWDFYTALKLKRNPGSERKLRYYKSLCTWLWIATALAVVAVGFRPLFTIRPSPGEISWLLLHPWVRYLVEALIAIAFIVMVALPVGVVIWKKMTKRPRKYSSATLNAFSYFFPATDRAPLVGVPQYHSGSVRRSALPRLRASLPARVSLDSEPHAGAADLLRDLRIEPSLSGCRRIRGDCDRRLYFWSVLCADRKSSLSDSLPCRDGPAHVGRIAASR